MNRHLPVNLMIVLAVVLACWVLPHTTNAHLAARQQAAGKTGAIHLSLIHPDGSPVADATVMLFHKVGRFYMFDKADHSDQDGKVDWPDLPANTYRISIRKAGHRPAHATVSLEAGQELFLTKTMHSDQDIP